MEEKLLFQYIMNYKAYRRVMIATRIMITLVLAGAAATVSIVNLALGILVPIVIAFIGAIFIIAALHNDETYMVFEDRVVIKSGQKRRAVAIDQIKSVSYHRAFYEKDLATGTVKIRATADGKKAVKTYRLKHVFDARPLVDYLTDKIK